MLKMTANKSQTKGVLVIDTVAPYVNGMKHIHQLYLEKKERELKRRDKEAFENNMQPIPPLHYLCLARFIQTDLILTSMMYDSFNKLKTFTKSDGGLIYLASEGNSFLYICPTFLAPSFKGAGRKYDGGTLVSWVAKHKKPVVTNDIASDARFEFSTGDSDICVKAAMAIPILTAEGGLLAVIELWRKPKSGPYNIREQTAAKALALWMGANIGINHEICYWSTKKRLISYLLHMVYYFTSTLPMRESNDNMISAFMNLIKSFLNVGQARLYLKHIHGVDVYLEVHDEITGTYFYEKSTKNLSDTIAEYVLTTGEHLNLDREQVAMYKPMINNSIEVCILCYPIKKSGGEIKGAIELVNKMSDENHFTEDDEVIVKLITKFGLLFLRQYENLTIKRKLEGLMLLHGELIDGQMTPCKESLEEFASYIVKQEKFLSFDFVPENENTEYLARLSQEVFSLVLGDGYYSNSPSEFFLSIGILHKTHHHFTSFIHSFLVLHCLSYILLLHNNFFTQSEMEEMMLSAIMHTISAKKNKRQLNTVDDISYKANICKIVLLKYNCYTKDKFESIQSLFKVYSLRHSFMFHKKLLKLLVTNKFQWTNPAHRFLVKALIIRIAENSVWYKPSSYAASRASSLYVQYNKSLLEEVPCKKQKILKRTITKKRFFLIIEKEITHQYLPNIYILSIFMDNLKNLADLCSENLRQWQGLQKVAKCDIWHQDMSWVYVTMADGEEVQKNWTQTEYLNLLK